VFNTARSYQESSAGISVPGGNGNSGFGTASGLATIGVYVALVCGCSNLAGPDYKRPEVAQKANWSQLSGKEITASEIIQPDWWKGFGDPYLDGLIDEAVKEGLDLKIAAARLDKAGVELKKERFPLTPNLSASPSDSIKRSKGESGSASTTRDTERLGATLSWELDIWGKIRKGTEAAEAGYKATEMDWRAAYLTLVAGVADRYFQIRLFDEQISQQVAAENQNKDLLQIYEAQYREGMIPKTKILNQKSELKSLKKQLLDLQRSRDESELKLATLLGKPAGELSVPRASLRDTIHQIDVPEVLPADLLARRPDILRAEYELLRTHNLVGKARLARLPTFSLTAAANSGGSLTDTLINTWSFGLTNSFAPMFDRNLKIDVKVNEAELRVKTAEYRKSVLQAFEETEVALLNLESRKLQMRELEQQAEYLEVVRSVQLARLKEGLVTQLQVFDTERTLLNAQQGILSAYQQTLNDSLILYKALGGGWPEETVGVSSSSSTSKPAGAGSSTNPKPAR